MCKVAGIHGKKTREGKSFWLCVLGHIKTGVFGVLGCWGAG